MAHEPSPFAIFYGWPSLVNGAAGALTAALSAFEPYPLVVLGEDTVTRSGDPFAAPLTAALRSRHTRVYGYVNLAVEHTDHVLSLPEVRDRLRAWTFLPADGILLDCAGADYGVERGRLDRVVDAAHELGLRTLVNAWIADDALAGPSPLGPADGYLAEGMPWADGVPGDPGEYLPKLESMAAHRQRLGVRLFAAATVASEAWSRELTGRLLAAVAPYELDWFCLADPLYGAADNTVPGMQAWPGRGSQPVVGTGESA